MLAAATSAWITTSRAVQGVPCSGLACVHGSLPDADQGSDADVTDAPSGDRSIHMAFGRRPISRELLMVRAGALAIGNRAAWFTPVSLGRLGQMRLFRQPHHLAYPILCR